MDRPEIAAILASAGLKPQHHFGQNFMVDVRLLEAIVAAGDIQAEDLVLEVGPGVGNLTRLLAQRASRGHVLAVDIDSRLLAAARAHHGALQNVSWVLADVLASKHALEPAVLERLRELRALHPSSALKLVSNLPYNAASPIIAELLVQMWQEQVQEAPALSRPALPLLFSRFAFTVQWEVGLRMSGSCGTRDYGPLGILIQSLADVEIVRKIPPGAFWPPPKIHSALLVVTPRADKIAGVRDVIAFQKFLAGVFGHRRQTLGNGLKHFYGGRWDPQWKRVLSDQGFDLLKRPETLAPGELLRLEQAVHELVTGAGGAV